MKGIIVVCVLSLASLALGASMLLPTPALANSSRLRSTPAFGGHDQLCLDNYNQCIKGCDGATSCSQQCKVNYDKCMQ